MPTVALKRIPHVITVGTSKVGIILPDEYGAIAATVGVSKTSGNNKPELSSSSPDLLKAGQALKIRISYSIAGKRRTSDVLCDIDKAKTAVTELVGKTFREATIITAYFPRRARYS